MQTSARNQFHGTVSALLPGSVNTEVQVALPGGGVLVAVLTQASVWALGLRVGLPVVALVAAPAVLLAVGGSATPLPVHNQWTGTVTAVQPGAVNAEVAVGLPDGEVVWAVVSRGAVADLGLVLGATAQVLIPASQVVLALPQD